jgi:hypothetical protein
MIPSSQLWRQGREVEYLGVRRRRAPLLAVVVQLIACLEELALHFLPLFHLLLYLR